MIYNNLKKKHREYIHWIFDKFDEIDIQIDIEKCYFDVFEIKYLKFIIDFNDIRINFVKIQVIIEWKTFTNIKKMFNFLNFENFYCRFINDFNFIVDSLIELIKKTNVFQWIDECQKKSQQFKDVFVSKFVLRHFDFDDEIQFQINVFDRICEKSIFQKNKNDVWKLIVYFFRQQNNHRKNQLRNL